MRAGCLSSSNTSFEVMASSAPGIAGSFTGWAPTAIRMCFARTRSPETTSRTVCGSSITARSATTSTPARIRLVA